MDDAQSLFLGGNTSVPRPIDMLLHLESLEQDLAALKAAVRYSEVRAAVPCSEARLAWSLSVRSLEMPASNDTWYLCAIGMGNSLPSCLTVADWHQRAQRASVIGQLAVPADMHARLALLPLFTMWSTPLSLCAREWRPPMM